MDAMICGVMLAAGLSSRMGENKLLVPFGESTVLAQSIARALEICEKLVVVVSPQLEGKFEPPSGVDVVVNRHPEEGQASSFACAVSWVQKHYLQCVGVLVFLADEPRFDKSAACEVATRLAKRRDALVVPRREGRIGHPTAFGVAWFDELAALRGDEGGRQILRQHPEVVEYVEADEAAFDIDTPHDYLEAVVGSRKLVVVRGAGDIATGVICRLHEAGFPVVALDIKQPTVIRRSVSFAPAIFDGTCVVEGVEAQRCSTILSIAKALAQGKVAVCSDAKASLVATLKPALVVDAILAKRNLGTTKDMAPVVIALGPGFEAGHDCHAIVETKRGHHLGRVLYQGSAAPNTGIPGNIAGYAEERVIHAPVAGVVEVVRDIGESVSQGEVIATIDGVAVQATLSGVVRGMIAPRTKVSLGLKMADIDPRNERSYCFSISDKARSIGGGVLEALLHLAFVQTKSD